MSPKQKILTSFTTRLTLWVAGFVLVISGVVLFLLIRFSEGVIRDEYIDTTLQVLETTALRIDNTLRQTELTDLQGENRQRVNRSRIEKLIEENDYLASLNELLPNAQLFVNRCDSSRISMYFAGNERGYRQIVHNGQEAYIFTQPVGNRQYNLAVVCPSEDIYGNYAGMHWYLMERAIVGIVILLCILYIVVGRHLRPLHQLADAAQSIADGRLNTPIPDAHQEHEAGRLQNSLKKMQTSLTTYMKEMQKIQTELSRQNAELQDVYGKAQAYETKKLEFLNSMTCQMVEPVEQVCQYTDTVCRDYTKLSKAEMARLQADIMEASQTITNLLDQLTHNTVAP